MIVRYVFSGGDLAKKSNAIVGLDVGTTKICAVVGAATENGVEIMGVGEVPSYGLKKGIVINIEKTVKSIQKAIEKAEQMAGLDIDQVYTGISGGHIKGFSSHGMVAIKTKEVTKNDVRRVIDAARAVALPPDREVIHIIPQEYIVDDHGNISEPIGMLGTRLEANVHIVSAAVSSAQNIIKCVNNSGLHVSDIVLQQIASSEAVLSKEEKDIGVALIDIGGGTTDIAIYRQGSLVHTGVISLGGYNVTQDISIGLRTPPQHAEEIKKKHGCCLTSMIRKEDTIEVPSVGGRKPRVVQKQLLAEIIEPRIEEIFQIAHQEIIKSGYEKMIASGIVITGGSCLLSGMPELAEYIFDAPVRRGSPHGISGLSDVVNSPIYATGVGLVLYGMDNKSRNFPIRRQDNHSKIIERMKNWFSEAFIN